MKHRTKKNGVAAKHVGQDSAKRVSVGPIPADEAWLFNNTTALKSVRLGLSQFDEAKVTGSFAVYAENDQE